MTAPFQPRFSERCRRRADMTRGPDISARPPIMRLAGAVALLAQAGVAQLTAARPGLARVGLALRDNARVVVAARAPMPRIAARCLNVRRDTDHLLSNDQGAWTARAYTGPRATREICKACWRPSAVGFTVPNEVWERAVHPAHIESVLCLACFTAGADERLVAWDREIEFWPVSAVSLLDEEAS